MKGDFTRFTFKPGRHYSAVRMQQGRVQTDADWNEQLDIQAHRERTEMLDIIGPCGVPEGEGGFKISAINADASGHGEALAIAPGRIYVDGLLCELEPTGLVTLEGDGGSGGTSDWLVSTGPALREGQWLQVVGGSGDGTRTRIQTLAAGDDTEPRVRISVSDSDLAVANGDMVTVRPLNTYLVQPDYPDPATAGSGSWMAYLDVWERHITALDDPAIREVALGGPDTATRLRTVWQVRLQELSDSEPSCNDFIAWQPAGGRMAAHAEPGGDDSNPCIIPEDAGYRRLENQLYRVEIHDDGSTSGGTPTFKWSRDNGSLVVRLRNSDVSKITVSHPRSDPVSQFATNDWVEVLDEAMILRGEPGVFIQIGEINGNELAIKDNPSGTTLPTSGMVRRWEGGAPQVVDTSDWIALESGAEVRFDSTDVHAGDYWTIPARTITRDVEWPRDESSGEPLYLAPQGIVHHSCPLAVVEHHADGDWSVISDCREEFPPLTDLPLGGCCLRVEPGDDLQQTIDRVIQRGGGCICLGAGVHEHSGPLRIDRAESLQLHGAGSATVLRLLADEEAGGGGLILRDSQNVNLADMSLLGVGVNAVISIAGGPLSGKNRHIRLQGLSVINTGTRGDGEPVQAALWLADGHDISLRESQLIAENGIVCTFGDQLPAVIELAHSSTKYGSGVKGVSLQGVQMRYANAGIWSFRSDQWDIDACDLRAVSADELAGNLAKLADAQDQQLVRLLPDVSDDLLEQKGSRGGGTGIRAFVWRDCTVRDSRLRGARGVDAWWYLRSQIDACHVEAGQTALHADWMHEGRTVANRLFTEQGPALSFVGSYRGGITDNHVRADQGIVNLPWQQRLFEFLDYVDEATAFYAAYVPTSDLNEEYGDEVTGLLVFWMLFRETVRITGLTRLVSATLDAFVGTQMRVFANFLLSYMVYVWLQEYREREQDANEPNLSGLLAVALDIAQNDIETTRGCIRLEKLFLMGGARLHANRLHSGHGRAVQLDAIRMGEHIHLLNALWRYAFKEMIDNRIPGWMAAAQEAGNTAWLPVFQELLDLARSWSSASEGFMEADYRIDGNAVTSQGAAIASNLWELAVNGNHITLREQVVTLDDGMNVIDAFLEHETTLALARAVRHGTREGIEYAGRGLADEMVMDNAGYRVDAAEAMMRVSARVVDPGIREASNDVADALRANDRGRLMADVDRLSEALAAATESHGILLRNPGCRVSDNHVLVPLDADPESWARGGITLTTVGGEGEQGLGSMQLLAILAMLGFEQAFDPVVGITETLIADNETLGGYGHGIHIDSPIMLGETRFGLSDIRICGNQVRGMGGAGIVVSDETYAVGVQLSGNQLFDCSSRERLVRFTAVKGGIVVINAGACRIQNNRVVRCANGLEDMSAFGMHLDTVLGLQIDGNELTSNGSQQSELTGGIFLQTVADGTKLHDNRFDRNRGYEIRIDNGFSAKEIPAALTNLVNFYARREDSGDSRLSAISIQDNRIHARHGVCRIDAVDELTFSGNQVVMPFAGTAAFTRIGTGIFSHNKVRMPGLSDVASLSIAMASGTLLGNVCDGQIQVSAPSSSSVQHGLNIPAVDVN